ncbi:MAG: hypothetical protein WBB45_15085 [Cyclobacteriaceae bacterium]
MIIKKEIKGDNKFYLFFNGKLIFKKWLDQGYSKVFDHFAWSKYTEKAITDFDLEETPPLYHVECQLTLITKEEGGRETPIENGYRPNHVFEYWTKMVDT